MLAFNLSYHCLPVKAANHACRDMCNPDSFQRIEVNLQCKLAVDHPNDYFQNQAIAIKSSSFYARAPEKPITFFFWQGQKRLHFEREISPSDSSSCQDPKTFISAIGPRRLQVSSLIQTCGPVVCNTTHLGQAPPSQLVHLLTEAAGSKFRARDRSQTRVVRLANVGRILAQTLEILTLSAISAPIFWGPKAYKNTRQHGSSASLGRGLTTVQRLPQGASTAPRRGRSTRWYNENPDLRYCVPLKSLYALLGRLIAYH